MLMSTPLKVDDFKTKFMFLQRKELEEEFARCEETFQMTRKLGTNMAADDLIDEESRALVQRDLDTLEQKWMKIKEHRDSAQVSRYLNTRTVQVFKGPSSPTILYRHAEISIYLKINSILR